MLSLANSKEHKTKCMKYIVIEKSKHFLALPTMIMSATALQNFTEFCLINDACLLPIKYLPNGSVEKCQSCRSRRECIKLEMGQDIKWWTDHHMYNSYNNSVVCVEQKLERAYLSNNENRIKITCIDNHFNQRPIKGGINRGDLVCVSHDVA